MYKVLDGQMKELMAYELMSANDAPERDPMNWCASFCIVLCWCGLHSFKSILLLFAKTMRDVHEPFSQQNSSGFHYFPNCVIAYHIPPVS